MTKTNGKRLKNSAPQHSVTKKKLKWVPMEICRVPLNPEQAVLTCCNSTGKAVANVPISGLQCYANGSFDPVNGYPCACNAFQYCGFSWLGTSSASS